MMVQIDDNVNFGHYYMIGMIGRVHLPKIIFERAPKPNSSTHNTDRFPLPLKLYIRRRTRLCALPRVFTEVLRS